MSSSKLKGFLIMLLSLIIVPVSVYADNHDDSFSVDIIDNSIQESATMSDDIEDIQQHDIFEFEASIKESDIVYGTGDFDKDDKPGNDSGPKNGIVRTWDTATYPLKITVNPKEKDMLENIRLRFTGSLDNGITEGDRVNGKFAVGGTEDIEQEVVSFEQEYTIERTGNSIMIPVAIEVQGAKNGIEITPNIKVEVVSVDGELIEGVESTFDNLPSITTSAKVNIKPIVGSGYGGAGYQYYPNSKMVIGGNDRNGVHAFAISWGLERLPGKSDIRGTTFPDPDGNINYTIELYGDVYWDNKPHKHGSVDFDFENKDVPFQLYDHHPIDYQNRSSSRNRIGHENTMMEGMPYTHAFVGQYVAANSKMPNYHQDTIDRWSYNTVWDSGEWSISEPQVNRDTVVYKGSNTGFMIGSTFPISHSYVSNNGKDIVYSEADKVFSTNGFIIDLQNEYRIDGKLNPNNYTNTVYNRVRVSLDNYTDENGKVTEYNKGASRSYALRNGTGNLAAYGTFQLYPSGYTSPKNPRNHNTSVGDASILIGQDVNFTPRINTSVNLFGGYKAAYRWNTDAFELTSTYAKQAETNIFSRGYRNLEFDWVRNDRVNQSVSYGVAKFEDNSFDNFTSKDIEDYDWYDTYDDAIKYGDVGAMLSDILAEIGGIKGAALNIPLRVKHENIGFGSITKDGTPVIALINAHAFLDEGRDRKINATKNRSYDRFSEWDSNGYLDANKIQRPVGGSVNFESLGIVPAKTTSRITADKQTYYNSENVDWSVKNSIVLPPTGVPNEFDSSVELRQTLPKGLDYINGSGKVGSLGMEPEIYRNSDGTTDLVWDVLISDVSHTIDDISFSTSINPYALKSGSVQSGLSVKNVIFSELDGRPERSRTDTETITILKVGMVGIHETINKLYGGKNSDYTLELKPYTTIEEENNVVGLTHVPQNTEKDGSQFSGSVMLNDIELDVDRVNSGGVSIYLNNKHIESNRPNDIDVSRNGWYRYEPNVTDLSKVNSLFFKVNGTMSNKDDISIRLNMGTEGNEFGDRYLNRTVINSDTNYKLSPQSNTVQYTIRADLELSLERVRIYTDKEDRGLPTNVWVHQVVLDEEKVKDSPITISINNEQGERISSLTTKQKDLDRRNHLQIPAKYLDKNSVDSYTIRLEDYDEDRIWVKDGRGEITLDGHTATELVVGNDDGTKDLIKYEGVVATEKTLDGNDKTHKFMEEFEVSINDIPKRSSGYGYEVESTVKYKNELLQDALSNGINDSTDINLSLDSRLIDQTLEYKSSNDVSNVMLDRDVIGHDDQSAIVQKYQLPPIFMQDRTGDTFTQQQVSDLGINDVVEAGNKLYIPVWIDEIGDYSLSLTSQEQMGSNYIRFDLVNKLNIECYMMNHIDSDTQELDVLLLHPLNKNNKLFEKYGE